MLMSPNKDETAVPTCHCPGDMAVRMRKVLSIPRSCVVWPLLSDAFFWVCKWNPKAWPFVSELLSNTFLRYCSLRSSTFEFVSYRRSYWKKEGETERVFFSSFFFSDLSDALDEELPRESAPTEVDHTLYSDQPFGPVAARKVTEVVQSAVGILKTAIDFPKEFITDAARPGYWVPDAEISDCVCCKMEFKGHDTKHHCRACGMGVCSNCSESRRPVPSRGWDHPVRVCDQCAAKKGQL